MTNEAATSLEMTMENARHHIELAEAMKRLENHPDFKKVILEGYFNDECIRLVYLKGAPNMQAPEQQAKVLREMDGISALRSYFYTLLQRGEWAQDALEESQRELEMMEEEAAE